MTNSWIGTLVVLLVIAAQVIPAILQAIAKKRAEDRARQMAAARKAQTLPDEFRAPEGLERAGESRDPLAPQPAGASADDLARRRQIQLEQLRNRREARRENSTTVVRTGSTSSSGGPAGQGSGRMNLPSPTVLRPQDVKRRGQAVDPARAAQQEAARARQQAAQAAKALQKATDKAAHGKRSERPQAASEIAPPRADDALTAATRQRRDQSVGIMRRFRQPSAMRQAFILKELLDPPLSLRQGPNAD